jgi:hypothetical protein
VIRRVLERRLTQVKAAQLLGLGPLQIGRLSASAGTLLASIIIQNCLTAFSVGESRPGAAKSA